MARIGSSMPPPPPEPPVVRLDPDDESSPLLTVITAEDVLRRAFEPDGASSGLRLRRKLKAAPVVACIGEYITGTLSLRAMEFAYLLEFSDCRFEKAPDFRQTHIAGCDFANCRLPGLLATNLTSDNDLVIADGTVVTGTVDLTDANIQGSLVMHDSRLSNPDGLALHADRLQLAGAWLAKNMVVHGETRVPGLRTGGNVNLNGSTLHNPAGFALNGNGMHVGGNLHCRSFGDRAFTSVGRFSMPNARVDSDFSLRGAVMTPATERSVSVGQDPFFDPVATLIADRVKIEGNVELDAGLHSTGTLRMVNARIGGAVRMANAVVDLSGGTETFDDNPRGRRDPHPFRSLHFDGTEIRGGMDARGIQLAGQARLVDTSVQGSVLLDNARLANPNGDALEGRRLFVAGNLDGRGLLVLGSFLLPGAVVGANLDLRGSRFVLPGQYPNSHTERPSGGPRKPSLDLRVAKIGRDLICAAGTTAFSSTGEIRMRRAEVGRETNFDGAELRTSLTGNALNAFGLRTQELRMRFGRAPEGRVSLSHAYCASFADNKNLWDTKGGIEFEDFRYDTLAEPIALRDDRRLAQRLDWLWQAMLRTYSPGPYDQLAAMLRASGNEEHAASVLIEKQKRRYIALAEGSAWFLRPGLRLWSTVQRATVGYGYRPMRALGWLFACLAIGSIWFASRPEPMEINADDTLVWNPVLYTLDLLVPIIDFGHKNRWHVDGAEQWIAASLVAVGWILATTVAAGLTRMLRRNT